MMNPNPKFLIYYACVAKGTTILAEFNSKDADLGALAAKCLEKTPAHHSIFSHTIRDKTYMFLLDDSFLYFAIFDENLDNSEGLSFLKSVKDAFNDIVQNNSVKKRLDSLNSHCFQGEFNPLFHQLLASNSEFEAPGSPRMVLKLNHGGSERFDSPRGQKIGSLPLLGDVPKRLKKKKKRFFGDSYGETKDQNKVDVSSNDSSAGGLTREFSVVLHKNVVFSGELGQHQKAKRVWKKHVWIVLSLDLIVCSLLFGIWLWICRGFKCING
ncbi:unnamed protein product [Ilex paraguariensis]|uniref:Longin domain-containing protein n=1 Tax=Ilex paraguariensis TaxID=185542 RepID=A0ABC8SAV4_9AQUA